MKATFPRTAVMSEPLVWPHAQLGRSRGSASTALSFGSLADGVYRVVSAPAGGVWDGRARVGNQPVQAAAQRLVTLVAELCSPEGGWPSHLPQTPETLLPYVSEETDDLIEVLQRETVAEASALVVPAELSALQVEADRDRPFAELMDVLLWATVASTETAMRWVEGVQATINGVAEPSFGVRLVPVLVLQTDRDRVALDLVTQTPVDGAALLPLSADLQVESGESPAEPQPVQGWLARLWDDLARHCPEVVSLAQGWTVDYLVPEGPWRTGRLHLELQVMGVQRDRPPAARPVPSVPESSDGLRNLERRAEALWSAAQDAADQSVPLPEVALPAAADVTLPEATAWLSLIDEAWLADWGSAIALDALLPPNRLLPQGDRAAAAHELVRRADGLRQRHQAGVDIALGGYQHSLLLSDLIPHLRWVVLHTHPVVMTLMGGVESRCLVPEGGWQWGQLGLTASLHIQRGEEQGDVDLATGEWGATAERLPETGILQFPKAGLWAGQTWRVAALTQGLTRSLSQVSPLVRLWLQGTVAELSSLDPSPLGKYPTVQLRLTLGLRFQPQPRAAALARLPR
ncbi:MAG: hypothetical protein IGR92_06520 [Leptolyngbyaceae cyanobacterium T60_A2020_046]|nr:hypothetical protein [Leptolyngbyaceae cyanobacterium T60_A2020_046]